MAVTTGVLLALVGSGSFIGGCLARQPEINRLHRQVKNLQNANGKLRRMLDEQMMVVEVLEDEIRAYKFFEFVKKRHVKKELKKNLVFQYAMTEYVSILIQRDRDRANRANVVVDVEKDKFFSIMEKYMDKQKVEKEDGEFVDQYIINKHGKAISKCQKWDYHDLLKVT